MADPSPDSAETARLRALHALAVLDTDPERRYDRIVELPRGNALQAVDPPRQSWSAEPTAHVAGDDIASRCTPAQHVAGGHTEWAAAYGRLHVQVADVVGCPLPTSVVVDAVRTLLPPSPETDVDGRVPEREPLKPLGGSFVTAFAGRLDVETGQLTYAHTGYGLAVVLAPDGGHRWLASSRLPLRVEAGSPHALHDETVGPGEILPVLGDGYPALSTPPGPAADRSLAGLRTRCRGRLTAEDAVELATAWAAAEGHPEDLTVLALERPPRERAPS